MATRLVDRFQYTDGQTLNAQTDWATAQISGSGVPTSDQHDTHAASQVMDQSSTGYSVAVHQTALSDPDQTVEKVCFHDEASTTAAVHGLLARCQSATPTDATLEGYEFRTWMNGANLDGDIRLWDGDGTPQVLTTFADALPVGDAFKYGQNRITMTVVGSTITGYFNGEQVVQTTDSTYSTGSYVGFTQDRQVGNTTDQIFTTWWGAWDSTDTTLVHTDILQSVSNGTDDNIFSFVSCNFDTTPTAGNLLLAFVHWNDVNDDGWTISSFVDDQATSGWTLLGSVNTVGAQYLGNAAYWKIADGDESSVTVTFDSTGTGVVSVVELPQGYSIDDSVFSADQDVTTATLSSNPKILFGGGNGDQFTSPVGWNPSLSNWSDTVGDKARWFYTRQANNPASQHSSSTMIAVDIGSATTAQTVDAAWSSGEISTFAVVVQKESTGTNAQATGGFVSEPGDGYVYHKFTESGTFTPDTSLDVEYLVVAGGGGAGYSTASRASGGGGAGGMKSGTSLTVSSAQTITVGAGGAGGVAATSASTSGSGSSIGALVTTTGGGYGGGNGNSSQDGDSGGSGGGGLRAGLAGAGTSGEGNDGGAGNNSATDNLTRQGGGGGKSAAGSDGGAGSGDGGDGAEWPTGSGTYYAGGGAGYGGAAGLGGGGITGGSIAGGDGTANTGGGGGGTGAGTGYDGGDGGSGIVIIRYLATKATGGTVSTDGTYIYHTFTESGTFTPNGSVSDDFDRADSSTLGSNWTEVSGSYAIASGAATPDTSAGRHIAVWSTPFASADMAARARIYFDATEASSGVILSASNSVETHYLFELNVDDTAKIIRCVTGTNTTLDSAAYAIGPYSTHEIEGRVNGGLLEFWVNGSLLVSYDDSASPLTGLYAGIRTFDTGPQDPFFNNWSAGPVASWITAEYLTVAGGGGGNQGSGRGGGGGGAGGMLSGTGLTISSAQTVTIGAGGARTADGSDSSIGALVVAAGGGNGGFPNSSGGSGGSGGGAGGHVSPDGTSPDSGGTATAGQGNDGGDVGGTTYSAAGGGGGKGAVGQDAQGGQTGGDGGDGAEWPASSGTYYAGGGGGGGDSAGGSGGLGGGGNGTSGFGYAQSGTANTGGGGGGAEAQATGGAAGGSGIVTVRYLIADGPVTDPITDYVIEYRTTTGPGVWTSFADGVSATTGATVTGLTPGVSYDFRIAAVNSSGIGLWSNIATATAGAGGTVNIYIGDTLLSGLALGDTTVTAAYLGDTALIS